MIKRINSNNNDLGFFARDILIKGSKDCNKYLEDIGGYLNKNLDTFSMCLNALINVFVDKFKIIQPKRDEIWTVEEIKQLVNNEKIETNRKYLNKIIELMELAEIGKKQNKLKLIYDDFFFLKDKNWYMNKNKNSLNYPSLCFYLIKNPKVEEDFVKYFSSFELNKNNDKFPLYFLLLRIFSHKKIIHCDDYKEDDNKISKSIKVRLNKLIDEYLIKKNLLPKDINWIGLFTIDFFKRRINSIMSEIRNYLFNFDKFNGKEIDLILELLDLEIVNFIFFNTVEGKIEEICNIELKDNNQLNQLIDPGKILEGIISRKKQELETKFEESLQKCFKSLNDLNKDGIINEFYNDFIGAVKEAMENKKQSLQKINKQNLINTNENEIINFNTNNAQYNSFFDNMKSNYYDKKEFNKSAKSLINCFNYLKDYDIFDETEDLNIGRINLKDISIKKNDKIKVGNIDIDYFKDDNNNYIYYQLDELDKEQNIYLNDKLIDKDDIILDKVNLNKISIPKQNYVKENLLKKFKDIQEKNITVKEPILIFINANKAEDNFKLKGEYPENDNIIKSISESIDFYINVSQSYNPNDKLSYINLNSKLQTLRKMIEKTFNFEKAQFEDGEGDTSKINKLIKKFNEFRIQAKSSLDEYTRYYDEYNEKLNYRLQKPKELNKFKLPKISDIKLNSNDIQIDLNDSKVDYFVSLSKDKEINFHSGKFIKIIGPIIPEFYKNGKYTFQIFSFIDKNINTKLEKIDENEYFDCFRVPSYIEALKPLQIKFTVPNKKVEEPTEEEVSFYLILKLEGEPKEACRIECTFYIQMLPLKVYISSSKGSFFLQKDILKLNLGSVLEHEIINLKFEIPNFENYEIFNASYYVKKLHKNTSDKPLICYKKDKKSLEIKVDSYEENKNYLHFLLYMYITEDIKIRIEIETKIFKFEYILIFINLYDEYKEFKEKNCLICNNKDMNPSIKVQLLDQKETTIVVSKKKSLLGYTKEKKIPIKEKFNLIDLKEVNDLKSDNSLNVTLKINSEKIKLNLKKLKSISNESRYTSDDIKRKIEDYKKSVISKRKSEEIKFNNDGNLYRIICFINTKPIKLQGVEKGRKI